MLPTPKVRRAKSVTERALPQSCRNPGHMRSEWKSYIVVLLALGPALICMAQSPTPSQPATPDSAFEELPELKASEILKPEFLKGPHFVVREPVPTRSGMNEFTIDSEFGLFQADGNEMLLRQVKEIDAIARLREVSRGEEFKKSLIAAAKSPLNSAKNIVRDPIEAISNVPKGVMKFMGRAKETVKGIGKKGDDGEGRTMQQMIGYSRTQRKIALAMGVDPYTTNTLLQKELEEIAWASWAGGFTFSAATFPVSGPVGAALTVTNLSSSIDGLLQNKTAAELEQINRSAFRAMGASGSDADRILKGGAFTPTQSTAFAVNLKSLKGVANRGAFVKAAAQKSSNEADAIFCVQTAALMSQINEESPLARMAMLGDFPVCVGKDGSVILAFQWDYAAWTPGAAALATQVEELAAQSGEKKPVRVVVSGEMSPRLEQALLVRGFALQDRARPGPLK